MSVRRFYRGLAAAGLVTLVAAGVALAAAPVLQRAKAYTGYNKHVSLTYVVSARSAKRLIAGPVNPPLGTEFSVSEGSVPCPKAKRDPVLAKSLKPFALFSFPGATLKLSHGRYGFSVSKTISHQLVTGSPAKAFQFTLNFTGTVTSPTKISGTVRATGGPCTVKDPIAYTAKLQKHSSVAPGA